MPFSADKSERTSGGNSHRVAFDRFELDLRSGELRKDGRRIRWQAKPFQFLALLIENAGEVVTRDEVCHALWQTDTFVDFDHSLAAAVNKIREALGDSAENPRFIETLPKRGYRFIGKIDRTEPQAPAQVPTLGTEPSGKYPSYPIMLAVLPFQNFSGDTSQDYFSDGLTEEMITQLGEFNPTFRTLTG